MHVWGCGSGAPERLRNKDGRTGPHFIHRFSNFFAQIVAFQIRKNVDDGLAAPILLEIAQMDDIPVFQFYDVVRHVLGEIE